MSDLLAWVATGALAVVVVLLAHTITSRRPAPRVLSEEQHWATIVDALPELAQPPATR